MVKYPDKRKELISVFPEINDNIDFCKPGDILQRKGTKNKYTVVIDRYRKEYVMININLGYTFKGRVPVHHRDGSIPIKLYEFQILTSNQAYDYTVVKEG